MGIVVIASSATASPSGETGDRRYPANAGPDMRIIFINLAFRKNQKNGRVLERGSATTQKNRKIMRYNFDIATLATLVARTASADTTAPDPANPRVGWLTEQLLTCLEGLLIYEWNDPETYARIADAALDKLNEKAAPEAAALVSLAVFHGRLLLRVGPENEAVLDDMVNQFESVIIPRLKEGPRKNWVETQFWYNAGVFHSAYGYFSEAAGDQGESAKLSDRLGDKAGAAVSRFLQTVERLKDAIDKGDKELQSSWFAAMEQTYARLMDVTRDTAMEVTWGQVNGPCSMLKACVCLRKNQHPDWYKWVNSALVAVEKLGQGWQPIAQWIRAFDLNIRDGRQAEELLKSVADDCRQANEVRAEALLALAWGASARDDISEARKFIEQMQMFKLGAQHVLAVAARLL